MFICWTCHREVAIRVCIFCVYVVRVDVIVPTSQKGRAFDGEGFCFVPCLVQKRKNFVRAGYVAASFDIQQDASQAGCCVVSWEMLHVTEYGGLVHVFSWFSSPRKVVVFAILHQDLTCKSGFMLLLEMILSNLVLEQVKLF